MLDKFSGKLIIIIIVAVCALFIIRILSKQSFKLVKPTWLKSQTDLKNNTIQSDQIVSPLINNTSYGRNNYTW
jgi:hypothetical protein